MNRKLGRLIQPGMGIYFLVMLAFALTALLMEHPVVAAAEAAVTAMLFLFYQFNKAHRRRELEAFIQTTTNTPPMGARPPSPWRWHGWGTAP